MPSPTLTTSAYNFGLSLKTCHPFLKVRAALAHPRLLSIRGGKADHVVRYLERYT